MITEPNMGLKIWNNLTDPYDHAQLADNWAKVAVHDHSGNKGVQIPTAGIADGAITAFNSNHLLVRSLSRTVICGSGRLDSNGVNQRLIWV
jgi:hypothetical protein